MKKFYLIALLFVVYGVSVEARDRMWIFGNGFSTVDHSSSMLSAAELWNTSQQVISDETSWNSTICSSSCTDALELCKNYRIGSASKTTDAFGTSYTFGAKLYLYGFSTLNAPPTIPTTNYFAFNVLGNTSVTLYCNPWDAASKSFNVVNDSGRVVVTFATSSTASSSSTNAEIVTFNYSGRATKLTVYPTYLYGSSSALYIYAIKVTDSSTSPVSETQTALNLKKAGDTLINEEGQEVEIYTVLGTKVLSSTETSIDISALAKGVYIAKTPTGSLKFVK